MLLAGCAVGEMEPSPHLSAAGSSPASDASTATGTAAQPPTSSAGESGTAAPKTPTRLCVPTTSTSSAELTTGSPMTFAIIGDFGVANSVEGDVANLVATWNPKFVVSVGDNYYANAGGTGTGKYDRTVGAYYGAWLKDISTTGTRCPVGAAPINAFFPCLGNHDYKATPAPKTYLTYFNLPGTGFKNTSGNERYYDYVQGPVHFFVLNSNREEHDGTSNNSKQAKWLHRQLGASTSPWNIVYDHHPPYSSDSIHGSSTYMRWPFAKWGADVVISGHAHVYERIERNGIPYFVDGLGGEGHYDFARAVAGSKVRYCADVGAQKATATETNLDFEFYNRAGVMMDSFHLAKR
jgi:tartrate-resistant acid phosphatase type 5